MKNLIKAKVLLVLIISQISSAQVNENFNKISEKLENYFSLKREVISVHFNKSTYLTNEKIWFKGYVLDRSEKKLNSSSTNVYFQLLDNQGEEIAKQLLFCYQGTFTGDQILDLKLPSGKYYARFFTNYMNNFIEDESTTYTITILNPYDNYAMNEGFDKSNLKIKYFCENKKIIKNVKNQIVVKVTDCKGIYASNLNMKVLNHKNETIQTFKLNSFGIGKFDFSPSSDENYKIIASIDNLEFSEDIHVDSPYGLSVHVNNYTLKNKCIISLKTNEETFKTIENKKFYILIHQDENALIYQKTFAIKTLEETLIIDNQILKDGINSIRILNEQMSEICFRNIFKFPEENLSEIKINFNKDKLNVILEDKSNVSVTVLPQNTLAFSRKNNIKGKFLIEPYIIGNIENMDYYFEGDPRIKAYELDLWIQTNNSPKYEWNNILMNEKTVEKHPFEMGLTLSGTIHDELKKNTNYNMNMFSALLGLNEMVNIDKNNSFKFENLILIDSSYLNFQLRKNNKENTAFKSSFKIENNLGKLKFPWKKEIFECNNNFKKNIPSNNNVKLPTITNDNLIELEGVEVRTKKNDQILSKKAKHNALRGFKITPEMESSSYTLLNFIERNGFVVNRSLGGGLEIYVRGANAMSVNAAKPSPIVFINDIQYRDLSLLEIMLMIEVDEVYLSTTHLEPSLQNFVGKIVIYTKTGWKVPLKSKDKLTEYVIKNGFSPRNKFKNNEYKSTNDEGFENYGVIHWEPFLEQKEGVYISEFNSFDKEKIFVQIEGITEDGKIISIQQIVE
jgi:hypothetical protein